MQVRLVIKKEVADVDKGRDFYESIQEFCESLQPYTVEARVSDTIDLKGDKDGPE